MLKRLKYLLSLGLLSFASYLVAQSNADPDYATQYTFAAGGKLTVQNVATTGSKGAGMVYGFYSCDAAATVTVSINGTAANSTTNAIVSLAGGTAPSQTAWKDSNVGAGTTISSFPCAANEKNVISMEGIRLIQKTTATNVSIAISAGTGIIGMSWRQQ